MLYTMSLCTLMHKIDKESTYQCSLDRVISLLPVDPLESGMDGVLIGPNDLKNKYQVEQLKAALLTKHPDILVMYIATSQNDANKLPGVDHVRLTKKIKLQDVEEEYRTVFGDHVISLKARGQRAHQVNTIPVAPPEPEPEPVPMPEPEPMPMPEPEPVPMPVEPIPVEIPIEPESMPQQPLENSLNAINEAQTWMELREQLDRNAIVRQLIEESNEYAGLMGVLDVLDAKIRTILHDPGLTADQRLTQILSLGEQRSEYKGRVNDANVNKINSILQYTTMTIQQMVTRKLNEINNALAAQTTARKEMWDDADVIEKTKIREEKEIELYETIKQMCGIMSMAQVLVDEEIGDFAKGLPSENEFVNGMFSKPNIDALVPANTQKLSLTLLKAISDGRVLLSQVEDQVRALIEIISDMLIRDKEIIESQSEKIAYLRANRVEDIVIRDSILKSCLRLFVGAPETGLTATTLMASGLDARTSFTVHIDFSGHHKLADYGVTSMSLSDFLDNPIEQEFVVIEDDLPPYEDLPIIIAKLKEKVAHYGTFNIVFDHTQVEAIKVFKKEALSCSYLTNCTNKSLIECKDVLHATDQKNCAIKVMMIDPPDSPLKIATRDLAADPTKIKVLIIPSNVNIRHCAYNKVPPYELSELRMIYKEALR